MFVDAVAAVVAAPVSDSRSVCEGDGLVSLGCTSAGGGWGWQWKLLVAAVDDAFILMNTSPYYGNDVGWWL